METEEKIVRTYFRHCAENYKKERLTIGGIYTNNVLKVGISRCSNKDQFEKNKGREIAIGRAEKCPVAVINTTTPKKSFTEIWHNVEKQFNDKDQRNEFLNLINQNAQDIAPRETYLSKIGNRIKSLFN